MPFDFDYLTILSKNSFECGLYLLADSKHTYVSVCLHSLYIVTFSISSRMCDGSRDTFVFALSPFLTSKELKNKGKAKIEESNRREKKAAAAGMLDW